MLTSLTNEAALIKMGQGRKEITDMMARDIESQLNLPLGWMDRDNDKLIKYLSPLDYEIAIRICDLSKDEKDRLLAYLKTTS